MSAPHLFTSERLGFRPWEPSDLEDLTRLCTDPEVMRFFPARLGLAECVELLERLIRRFEDTGLTYFAVDELEAGRFIGFLGLAHQDYEAPFNPSVDVGWRLLPEAWGRGLAAEGAARCLRHGFEDAGLERIVATCPVANAPSEKVMQRIGMERRGTYLHPALADSPELETCVWYEASPGGGPGA